MLKKIIFLVFVAAHFGAIAQIGEITPIHKIQGTEATSPLEGKDVTIHGIVTAVFAGKDKLNGFFVQELKEDNNPLTSEGIFVHDPSQIFKGQTGNIIQVSGQVNEFKSNQSSLTQIKNIKDLIIVSINNKLPKATVLSLPIENLEPYEGMLVQVKAQKGSLYVTEMYNLGRFGQIILSASGPGNQQGTDGRLDQFTQFNSPSTEGYKMYLDEIKSRKITVDDGSGVRNPETLPFSRTQEDFNINSGIRGGDRVTSVTGIIDDRFDGMRIHAIENIKFHAGSKRTDSAPKLPKKTNLVIAGFNVLNYFNGDGQGGGFPTQRGANSLEEFNRQHQKTVNVILKSNADVISLMEIENDGFGEFSAIQTLVKELNKASNNQRNFTASQVTNPATDFITSAIIYDANKVKPASAMVTIPDGYGSAAFDSSRRKPLIQTFQDLKTQAEFTLVAVHFKSKGSLSPGEGNKDQKDGQGQNNLQRVQQSTDLYSWLQTKPTGTKSEDYVIIGDFNSYAMEDPMTYFYQRDFKNIFPTTSYSYVYDGQWGALDHAIGTDSFRKKITKAVKWNINSNEAPILDYNTENKTPEQIKNYYNTSVYRSSDHDPIIIGVHLK